MGRKPLIPGLGGLLESIQGFSKKTDMIRMSRVHNTRGLFTVHWFVERPMKKQICNIELVNGPLFGDGKSKNRAHCCRLNDRAKSFIIVDAR